MKNKIKDILIVILTIIIILLIIQLILNKNKITNNNKKIIKEMNEGTQVIDLNNQINSLNTEHTEYMNYIQACKEKIAIVITNEGIATSANDTFETMTTNIENIFLERTKLNEFKKNIIDVAKNKGVIISDDSSTNEVTTAIENNLFMIKNDAQWEKPGTNSNSVDENKYYIVFISQISNSTLNSLSLSGGEIIVGDLDSLSSNYYGGYYLKYCCCVVKATSNTIVVNSNGSINIKCIQIFN